MPSLLVVAVVMVPDSFSRLGWVAGRFRGGCDQQAPKNAGAATGPPLGHLIDGLTRVAFEVGERVDGRDWKVHFQADRRSTRIAEISDRKTDGLAEVGRLVTVRLLASLLPGRLLVSRRWLHSKQIVLTVTHHALRDHSGGSSMKGTATSRRLKPP